MIDISLTDFVDFVSRSGKTKLTKVKQLKTRTDYGPEKDYYRTLRNGIRDMHQHDKSSDSLDNLCLHLNKSKQKNYPEIVTAYKRFLGRKEVKWFSPPRSNWKHNELEIRINPELGLEIDGTKYILKLYFKSDKLSKGNVGAIIQLMENELGSLMSEEVSFGILDCRKSKIILKDNRELDLMPLLKGEADSLITIWNSI